MVLGTRVVLPPQGPIAADKGLADDDIGWFASPSVPGGKGNATDTLGGINGWLDHQGHAQGGRRLPEALRLA